MIPPGTRAIFFDAVGTLIHPDPPAPKMYAAVGGRYGSRLSLPVIAARFRNAFRRQEDIDLANGLRTSEEREHARWRQIVGEVLDDVSDPAACFRELFAHFGRPESWRCDPDAVLVLHKLTDRGFMLGIASNYDTRLRDVTEGWRDLGPIRHLVISSEVGWRKPAPGFFEAMTQTAGLPAERILHIGDDPTNDYDGARQAGLHALLLDPDGRTRAPALLRIDRLSDLLD